MKRIIGLFTILTILGLSATICSPTTHAVTASDWRAGNIISDQLFFSGNDMSQGDIQSFLNARMPICDTWGTKIHSSGMTRAQYGTSIGVPPPYICVKDYYENPSTRETNFNPSASIPAGAKSAAQIIYEASVRHNINPKVILVTIQKEAAENILGDDWPWPSQYRSITGYGCPDTAPCDAEYYGFYNQIENAAKQFRRYATYPESYRYKTGQVNFVQYNPSAACSGTNVSVETQATAGLYNYTPYQPNAAALNNMYGSGDGCSAYGNRNFWRIWNDWFGPTSDERLFYRVIRGDSTGEVYLQTHQGKYYVPSYELLGEWGLGPNNVVVLPQAQVNALPTKNTLSNVLTDGSGLLYVVEGGNLHQVTSPNHTAIWGVDTPNMVESLGLSYALPKKEPLGRFISEKGGDGSIWLINGNSRHLMPSGDLLYAWGYYPGITNDVSSFLFKKYEARLDSSFFAETDNGSVWAIEASTKRSFKNNVAKKGYVGNTTPTKVLPQVLNLLPNGGTLTNFAVNSSTGQWFFVDNGHKRYIPQGDLAALWGKPDNEPLTVLPQSILSSLPTAPDLSYVARSESSGTYWLIAKNKHAIANGGIYASISGSTESPSVYSDDIINSLPTGPTASTSIRSTQSPYNYAYLLDSGKRRYPYSSPAQSAWLKDTLTVPYQLMTVIPESSFVGNIIKDQAGSAYYVENYQKYPIPEQYFPSFGVSTASTQISTVLLQALPTGDTMSPIIKTKDNRVFLVTNGKKILATKHRDTIEAVSTQLGVDLSGIDASGDLSYLVTSNDQDGMWLLSSGSKTPLQTFEQRVAFGYLSNAVKPTVLSQSTLDAIPDSGQQFNSLIQKPGSGIKFLNFGHSLGFPDGATLIAYINPGQPILQVSPSVFDAFNLYGNISRLIYDDMGRYWWVDSGKKHYITSWDRYYQRNYPRLSTQYLYGITMNLLPTGNQVE